MSPFRWDVLLVGFVLAVPVFALGLRGDLAPDEMMTRVLWCLAAGWGVVSLLRLATMPPASASKKPTAAAPQHAPEPAETGEPSPAI